MEEELLSLKGVALLPEEIGQLEVGRARLSDGATEPSRSFNRSIDRSINRSTDTH